MTGRLTLVAAVLVTAVASSAPAATTTLAITPNGYVPKTVTLNANPALVVFGGVSTLSGQLATGQGNQKIDIMALECGGQPWGEIAHLIGVGHQNQFGFLGLDKLLERMNKGIRSVRFQPGRLKGKNLVQFFGGNLAGNVGNFIADYCGLYRPTGLRGNPLRRDQGFPGHAVQLSLTLFDYYQDSVCHYFVFLVFA